MQFSKITLILKLVMFLKSSIMNKKTILQPRGLFRQPRFRFNSNFTNLLKSNKIFKKDRPIARAVPVNPRFATPEGPFHRPPKGSGAKGPLRPVDPPLAVEPPKGSGAKGQPAYPPSRGVEPATSLPNKAWNGLGQTYSGNIIERASISCILSRVENNHCFYGRFDIGPFSVGQGITVANMFRRTLLSELDGLAITAVEILGVDHEFFSLPGINESAQDILLNLKQIHFRSDLSSTFKKSEFAFLSKKGPAIVKASDIKLPASLKCIDPNQYIATLGFDGYLNIKMQISSGSTISRTIPSPGGQFLANQPKNLDWPIQNILDPESEYIQQKLNKGQSKFKTETKLVKRNNILPVDAIFMPVTKVNYLVSLDENKLPNNERIILEIWTNGSITPKTAIQKAANFLLQLISPLA